MIYHTGLHLAPKSMTLDDLERSLCATVYDK